MPPTPPTPEDDVLDLAGLGLDTPKPKAAAKDSDFEKELEALFAADLAENEAKAASAAPAPAREQEDVLLLDDLVDESAPAGPAGTDEVLDLSAFAEGGAMELVPPSEAPGGKDGGIDTDALDSLISGLGDKDSVPAPAVEHAPPHDEADMSDLLESIAIPKAAAKAAPGDELLELSLGDLVEGMPAAEPLAAAPSAASDPVLDLGGLELTLPDLSDPEPGRDTLYVPEPAPAEDLGGDLNLSFTSAALDATPQDLAMDTLLDSDERGTTGLMGEGLAETGEPEPKSLDPRELLDQMADEPALAPAAPRGGNLLDGLSLGDVVLGAGAAAAGAQAAKAAASPEQDAALQEQLSFANRVLSELQEKFAELKTQVTGGSVSVVRMEGRLAEKDQLIAALDERLQASQAETQSLRSELAALRGQLEESMRTRGQDAEKDATALKERLALVEDRQSQLDREVQTEISRAVPREAAKVIREEIAALAASMRDE